MTLRPRRPWGLLRQVDDKKRGKDKMKISTGITIVLLHTLIKLGGAAALRNTVLDINGMRFMITKYVFFFSQNMWNTFIIRGWAWVLRVSRAGRQHWQVFQHSEHISMMIIRNIYYDNYMSDTGKCLNTIKTCESEQDRWVARFWKWNHVAKYIKTESWLPSNYPPQPSRCLSTIRWSTTPYWTEGARKQYYITKQVAERAK